MNIHFPYDDFESTLLLAIKKKEISFLKLPYSNARFEDYKDSINGLIEEQLKVALEKLGEIDTKFHSHIRKALANISIKAYKQTLSIAKERKS